MQPSEYEIQREVEALRDLKRRSTTPGALSIDPDLPNPSASSSPTSSAYWSGGDGDSSTTSHDDGSSSEHANAGGGDSDGAATSGNDPLHLFWVPASVHPEIAPAEFRAFLKEHARSPSDGSMNRSGSMSSLSASSSGLGRKRSMLSKQYRPSEHDGVGEQEETIVPLRRNRTSSYRQGPQLTINDLQRLEKLAEEASESDDPSKLRSILRRSLSMNTSPSAMDTMDNIPDFSDEADAPIIVPPPPQILRRANRTKIRKPGLPGDGGGHRFGASRRGPVRSGTSPVVQPANRTSSDHSSSDHSDERRRTFDTELQSRPESMYSEETSIFDAYVREDDESEDAHPTPLVITASPPSSSIELPPIQTDPSPSLFEALEPVLHQPQPQRLLSPVTELPQQKSRTPSPSEPSFSSTSSIRSPEPEPTLTPSTPIPIQESPFYQHLAPVPTQSPPPHQRKEKDKKGLFGKWGPDKGGKKGSAKDREQRERSEKESKDSGFFGSLFGGKKNKETDGQPTAVHGGHAGREAAAALLGSSKSARNYQAPPSPVGSPGVNNWSRYPIHVERAIYRLSHIKLANPRRPLYEQVLISNLMFWYLGVINKAQSPASPNAQTNAAGAGAGAQSNGPQNNEERENEERERLEKERLERERLERERVERERIERERLEKEQKEKEMEAKKRESAPKRGPLTKPAPMNGGRRAEMPVKGPQYEMQHRVMEEEYTYGGYGNAPPNQPRTATPSNAGQRKQQQPQGHHHSQSYQHPTQDANSTEYYYSQDSQQQQHLPPGAMPPTERTRSPPGKSAVNGNPSRSRSPPQFQQQGYNSHNSGGGNGRPTRSLSAAPAPTASLPAQVNGKLKKGHSAYAGTPSNGRGHTPRRESEDEDVPLAVWQQQQQTNRRR